MPITNIVETNTNVQKHPTSTARADAGYAKSPAVSPVPNKDTVNPALILP